MIRPVDIPSFGWTWTVGDFGFTTTSRNYGEGTASSLSLPLSQLDEHDADGRTTHVASPAELWSMLIGGRRALVSAWWWEQCSDLRGEPLWWGVLGSVEGSQTAATLPLDSPMTLLGGRYLIRDGKFRDGTSTDTLAWSGQSYRGLCCAIIQQATTGKNGGTLPFELPYLGETGSHERTSYQSWNVQNLSVRTLLSNIANCDGGPDMMFQPYWSDERTARVRFLAGSDGDAYLPTTGLPQVFRYDGRTGGDIEDLTMTSQVPVQRFYGTGSGSDAATITALAEDLSSVTMSTDPAVLRESVYSDSDADKASVLKSKLTPMLASNKLPCIQLSGTVHVDDMDSSGRVLHPLPRLWPGSMCYLDVSGYRWLPDGRYQLRLMELSGDQSDKVTVTFDVVQLAI